MTDFEAVYEDIMRYMPANVSDIDSQTKLERFFRQNDRRGTMSSKLIDGLVETRGAQELIETNQDGSYTQRQQVFATQRSRAEQNRARQYQERRNNDAKGRKSVGTYTDKKGVRHDLFQNSKGVAVWESSPGRYRDSKGRFASK